MKKISNILFLYFAVASAFALSACSITANDSRYIHPNVNVQSVDSAHAKIKSVKIGTYADRKIISGEVQRIKGVHGPVFGHMDIRVLSKTGEVIYQSTAPHKTSTVIPRLARFFVQLPANIEENSTVTVSHHLCDWSESCED